MTSMLSVISNTFEIFGMTIHWYGVILTSAMVLAFCLFLYLARIKKLEVDFSLSMFLFAIIFAIIGARLIYVIPRAEDYDYFITLDGLFSAINISEGGLSIIGGIPAGAFGIYLACRQYKKSLGRVLDLCVPCLLLGQIIGRWGNIANSELYGVEITNELFQSFPFSMFVNGRWHASIPFYEMIINVLGLIIILLLMFTLKDKLKVGSLLTLYVVWYTLVRGILEIWKVGNLMWGNIGAIQLICYIIAPIALVVFFLIQFDIIKLETPKMHDKHFNIVHEPPAFVESCSEADSLITLSSDESVNDNNGNDNVIDSLENDVIGEE